MSSSVEAAIVAGLTFKRDSLDGVVIGFTLMLYDYVLNLGDEVELIWTQRYSSTVLAYAVLRYLGITYAIALVVDTISPPMSVDARAAVYLIEPITQDILIILLQGLLALRVWILYDKSKKLGFYLLIGYIAAQAISLTTGIMNWAVTPKDFENGHPYQAYGLAWTFPAANGALIGYETVLSILVLFHASKNLPIDFWRFPLGSARCIASIIVRDNLIYFLVALGELIGSSFSGWNLPGGRALAYWGVEHVLQITFLTMIGPWLILSLRRNFNHDAGIETKDYSSPELGNMMFQEGVIPSLGTGGSSSATQYVERV